jgi:hypothetical protein
MGLNKQLRPGNGAVKASSIRAARDGLDDTARGFKQSVRQLVLVLIFFKNGKRPSNLLGANPDLPPRQASPGIPPAFRNEQLGVENVSRAVMLWLLLFPTSEPKR